ncbi:hypothetical protein Tco_0364342 [Tanacetum coccineum]
MKIHNSVSIAILPDGSPTNHHRLKKKNDKPKSHLIPYPQVDHPRATMITHHLNQTWSYHQGVNLQSGEVVVVGKRQKVQRKSNSVVGGLIHIRWNMLFIHVLIHVLRVFTLGDPCAHSCCFSGCGQSTCSGGGVCGVCSGGEFSDLVQWVCSRDTMSVCMGSRHFAKVDTLKTKLGKDGGRVVELHFVFHAKSWLPGGSVVMESPAEIKDVDSSGERSCSDWDYVHILKGSLQLFSSLSYINYGVTCEDEAERRNSGAKTKTFKEYYYLLLYADNAFNGMNGWDVTDHISKTNFAELNNSQLYGIRLGMMKNLLLLVQATLVLLKELLGACLASTTNSSTEKIADGSNYGVTCEDEVERRNSGAKTKTFKENCYLLLYAVSNKEDMAYPRQLITRICVMINSLYGVSLFINTPYAQLVISQRYEVNVIDGN